MIIIISTIERFKFEIGLSDGKLELFKFETKNQSDELLPAVEKILKCKKISLQDIDKILVNTGPGSYTGVRVGVTTANAIAWSLDIPVFGFKEGNLEKTLAEIEKNTTKKITKLALPSYNN